MLSDLPKVTYLEGAELGFDSGNLAPESKPSAPHATSGACHLRAVMDAGEWEEVLTPS